MGPRFQLLSTPGEPERSAPRGTLLPVEPAPDEHALIADAAFDRLLDSSARLASHIHWTPADVCRRVARLLELLPGERALDVGSGVGKLCVLASKLSAGEFVGVEQRPNLVAQARWAAAALDSTAQFICADAFEVDWTGFRGLYFYNPFEESRFDPSLRIDTTLAFAEGDYERWVERTQLRLSALAPGTRVVTFHGLGGALPDSYQLDSTHALAAGTLQRWTQT